MSEIVTWDALAKAVGDLTKIVEQIADDIAAHNADNDAHKSAGGSLDGHRTAQPADHPDGSVTTATLADEAVTAAKVKAQQEWQAVEFENNWVNYGGGFGACAYFKDSLGIVHLRGLAKDGTVNTVIFTLPAGYRPAEALVFASISNNAVARITVFNNGEVKQWVGSNVFQSLDGITFRAEG